MSEEPREFLKQPKDDKGRPTRIAPLTEGVRALHPWVLSTEEIIRHQYPIMKALMEGLSPEAEQHDLLATNLYGSLLDESSKAIGVIAEFEDENVKSEMVAVICTTIRFDPVANESALLIYAMSPFPMVEQAKAQRVFDAIKALAREAKCRRIVAYTKMNDVALLARMTGADTKWRMLQWEVE